MTTDSYLAPKGSGEAVVVEKRSRFVGAVRPVSREQDARAFLDETRVTHRDAAHHVFAYVLREQGQTRFSDDGEPQGTGGLPVLEVLRREGIVDVCCVVTRYFGGVLLGAPGLVRAYARTANAAVRSAGVAVMRPWIRVSLTCPYPLWRQIRQEITAANGKEEETDYAADVTCCLSLPEGAVAGFCRRVTELSSGAVAPLAGGVHFLAENS